MTAVVMKASRNGIFTDVDLAPHPSARRRFPRRLPLIDVHDA